MASWYEVRSYKNSKVNCDPHVDFCSSERSALKLKKVREQSGIFDYVYIAHMDDEYGEID